MDIMIDRSSANAAAKVSRFSSRPSIARTLVFQSGSMPAVEDNKEFFRRMDLKALALVAANLALDNLFILSSLEV